MKFSILLEMLFDLLAKRKVTAPYFAEKFQLSIRTVYRYIDTLTLGGVPLQVKRGREGGICISDSFKLPKGFMTKEEYEAIIEALGLTYGQLAEDRFLQAKHKLSAQFKSEMRDLALSGDIGSILVDGGTWGDSGAFSEKLRLFEECIKEKIVLNVVYHARDGEQSERKIEPHILVFKQSVWYLYAFCHKQRDFRLFRVGRMRSAIKTDERFVKRPFAREDIPLNFAAMETDFIDVRFAVSENAFADVQDWLGEEHLRQTNGKWYADVTLPDDSGLVHKILGLGVGVQVLAPASLRERVAQAATAIAQNYS